MIRFAVAIAALLLLVIAAPAIRAGDPERPCGDGASALDVLKSRSTEAPVWKERRAGEGFSLTRLRIAEDGRDVEERAQRFLELHRAVWCVQNSALEISTVDRSDAGALVRARLTVGGLPVVDAGLRLRFNRVEQVVAVHSDMPRRMEVSGEFALTPEEGRAAAIAGAPVPKAAGGTAGKECSMVYFRVGRRLVPAYRCAIVTADLVSSFAVFVNAGDGDVLTVRPLAISESEEGR